MSAMCSTPGGIVHEESLVGKFLHVLGSHSGLCSLPEFRCRLDSEEESSINLKILTDLDLSCRWLWGLSVFLTGFKICTHICKSLLIVLRPGDPSKMLTLDNYGFTNNNLIN